MPYFDNATYAVGRYLSAEKEYQKERRYLKDMAERFLRKCERNGYPREIICLLKTGLTKEDRNILVIMADGATEFAIHMKEAIRKGVAEARTRQDRFLLLCITFTAMFTYRWGPLDSELVKEFENEREKYERMYGINDLLFLDEFFPVLVDEHIIESRQRRKELDRQETSRNENAAKEHVLIEQRKAKRAEEAAKKREEQKAMQLERNRKREEELALFRKKPLAEQLEIILSNRVTPDYYGIDFGAVTGEEMRALPKETLVRVITSFLNVKAAGWRQFQNKAKEVLAG